MTDLLHGFVGFVTGDEEKIVRADLGFEPSVLGLGTLAALRTSADEMAEQAKALRMVDPDQMGAADAVDLTDLTVRIQRNPADLAREVLRAGVALDGWAIPSCSAAVAWGYVVDFRFRAFEVYGGLQMSEHTEGRFALRPRLRRVYWPVRLVASWPLPGEFVGGDELPSDGEFLATVKLGAPELSWPGA